MPDVRITHDDLTAAAEAAMEKIDALAIELAECQHMCANAQQRAKIFRDALGEIGNRDDAVLKSIVAKALRDAGAIKMSSPD